LIELLAEHRVFTTEQITALAFSSAPRTRKRLVLLYRRGVLDRFRRYTWGGAQPWHWTLGPLGAAVHAAATGTPAPRAATLRERTDRLAYSPQLPHLVGTNGLFVDLVAHARAHPGADLAVWRSERQATADCADLVRPDGGGTWCEAGARVAFWLEYDTGTERPHTRLSGKLAGYAHLAGTKAGYPVLFWLPSAVREANLAAHLARVDTPAGVCVATASADHAAAHGGPAGPVWAILGRPGRLRLAALPAATDGAAWGA
jgi:hypothetical protein